MCAHLKVQRSETFQINMLHFKEEGNRQIKGYIDTLELKPKHWEPFFTGKAQSGVEIPRHK